MTSIKTARAWRNRGILPDYPTVWILWWAVLMHLAWGFGLIFDAGTNALVILVGLHWIDALGLTSGITGPVLVIISLMAAASLWFGRRLPNLVAFGLVIPQQILLLAAFVSDLQTIVTGNVPNAQSNVDRFLLFTVLWPVMVAAILHTAALVERHTKWIHRS